MAPSHGAPAAPVADSKPDRPYWVLFSQVTGVGPARFARLLERFGSARAAWVAPEASLAAVGLDRRSLDSLRAVRASTSAEAAQAQLQNLGISVITLQDEAYPASLREINDPPPVLFVRGEIHPSDQVAVAFVGTRRATPYGRTVAEQLAGGIAARGITVVSGLARGVDAVAHRAALDAGGRTIAVLGNGLDQVYPPEHAALARRITAEAAGAVVSEFPPGTRPDAANFPRRNRIIAGLCRATLVIEAGERSGALITADLALEQGRDVLAVPGSILGPMSLGTNLLIKQGATPVMSVADILEALGLEIQGETKRTEREPAGLSAGERRVWPQLGSEPRHVDDLARSAVMPAAELSAALTLLELKGLAMQVGPMAYIRV